MTSCILRKDGTADCGADHIKQGGSTSFWAYNAVSPITFDFKYTGVTKPDSDWVCGDRDPAYKLHDPERVLEGN